MYPEEETEDGGLEEEVGEEIEELQVEMEAMDRPSGEDHIKLQLFVTNVVDRDTWLRFVPVKLQIAVEEAEDLATEDDDPAAGVGDV